MNITFFVPSNSILLGEYFITQNTNSALCMAINIPSTLDISITPHSRTIVSLSSQYNNTLTTWKSPQHFPLYSLAAKLFLQYQKRFAGMQKKKNNKSTSSSLVALLSSMPSSMHLSAHINTNNLYGINKDGSQKLGLGSSAVCAILCCIVVLIAHGINPFDHIAENTSLFAHFAAHTHYLWQHKRGSGYDVYSSVYGGMGKYTQNNYDFSSSTSMNRWERLPAPKVYWYRKKNTREVSSTSAIEKFLLWQEHNPSTADNLCQKIQAHIDDYPSCLEKTSFHTWYARARDLAPAQYLDTGAEEGAAANADGTYFFPTKNQNSRQSILWKPVGAGDELMLGISSLSPKELAKSISSTIQPLEIAKGLHCLDSF